MRHPYFILVLGTVLWVSGPTFAQSGGSPAGATALCKDNTYFSGTTHRGACARHGGVQQWLAAGGVNSGPAAAEPTAASAPAPSAGAAPAEGAPTGATALCKDNTYYSGTSHRGACARHGGVQRWLAAGASPPEQGPAAQPATTMTQTTPQYQRGAASPPMMPVAAGEGDRVWVNTASKVYHCPSDRWYGKTSKGEYMSESQARAQGYRADHNRPCPT